MSLAADEPQHGTYYRYVHFKCRCEACQEANRLTYKRQQVQRASRLGDPNFAQPMHGKASTYCNWMCRCEPCTTANTTSGLPRQRRWRASRRVAS